MDAIMKGAFQVLCLLALLSSCLAAPSTTTAPLVVYPIRSQRPPVARVGNFFSWSLLPGTFNTSTGTNGVSFKVENLPSWATFVPETQTFSGTPASSDLGFTTVTIRAFNSANSNSVSDSLRLLVANGQSPTVKLPLQSQLGNGAVLASAKYEHATGGISVPPNWSWSVGLLRDTFVADHKTIYYTAYEAGTTSLPSWIKFNPSTATFDGVSPNEQKDTTIVVYGSDNFGYGDVQQTFRITVSAHLLDMLAPLPALNATAQSIVNYTIPFDAFTIDGTSKNASAIISAKVDLAQVPYLTYDEAHSSISGTLPASLAALTNLSIPITFSSPSCHNIISTQLSVRVVPGLFTAAVLPPFFVHPGENFTLNLAQYTSNLNATYTLGSITPSSVGSWLQFTTQPLAIAGKAPSTLGSKDQKIDIDLEASGLNGLRSTAHLPVIFSTNSQKDGNYYKKAGLPASVKLWLIIIFGTLGGLMLLILIMRTCRVYCSADGKRESFQDVYHPYYTYANDKMGPLKPSESPIKGTPYSIGDTLIDPRSPAWNSKAGIGGPMMAITKTEMTISGNEPVPESGLKRLHVFKVFSKPSPAARTFSPTQPPSLQGLGIVEPNYRVVHVDTESEPKTTDEADQSWRSGSADSGSRDAHTGAMPASLSDSEGERSSWNTTGSSSLFYTETQGDSDLGSSSRSGRWLETPSGSTPRRRKDFVPGPRMANTQFSSPSGSSAEGVDMGTIRMVVDDGTASSPARSMTDEDVKACSESIGAIKTASYRRITADYSSASSGVGTSEANSAAHRPKLIPFQGRQVQDSLPTSSSDEASSAAHPSGPETHLRLDQQSNDADFSRRQRLSIQSDKYKFEPSSSKPGSPATSAIFFAPSEQPRYPVSKPSPMGATSSVRAHSPLNESHTAESFNESAAPLQGLPKRSPAAGLPVFSIGVGEPFHMTPSVKPQSSSRANGPDQSLAPGDVHTYYALTDYPSQPALDRKQLPDWLHFDATECEVWGIPRKIDAGLISIQIIESKPFSRSKASPDASNSIDSPALGRQRESEDVVARFTLEVVDKSSFPGAGAHGDVTTVTF